MKITNVEAGTIVVVLLAIIAGAVQFGRLQGQIEGLDGKAISDELDRALREIDEAEKSSIAVIEEQFVGRRGARWIDTKDDRTEACVSGGPGTQYCQAANELGYPITVAIVTVHRERPKDVPSRGCGAGVHLVRGTPDWHTPRAWDDAVDLTLATMVTGDKYGVCWVSATIPTGSSYYLANAYWPHVEVVSWLELR